MTDDSTADALRTILASLDPPLTLEAVHPLTGGASRQTFSIDASTAAGEARRLIAQREVSVELRHQRGMAAEAEIVALAHQHGVPVPTVVATNESHPDAGFGRSFFITQAVEGETIARRILRDDEFATARANLGAQLGRAIATLHQIDPGLLPTLERPDDLQLWGDKMTEIDLQSPIFALGLRWLDQHRPEPNADRIVHGDFRIGNLIIDENGLAAVIDWELAHIGDPYEDLGWVCTRAWRFGGAAPVAGIAPYEELFDAYESVSGQPVDRDAVRWWELLGSLKWGIMCGTQAERHRSGAMESMEHLAIGNRMAEQEYDVVCALLPDDVSPAQIADGIEELNLDQAGAPQRGMPTASELSHALHGFLMNKLSPGVGPELKFHTRVAANIAAMISRQSHAGAIWQERHNTRLHALSCDTDAELVARIEAGDFDGNLSALAAVLAPSAAERLAIVNPKWLL